MPPDRILMEGLVLGPDFCFLLSGPNSVLLPFPKGNEFTLLGV